MTRILAGKRTRRALILASLPAPPLLPFLSLDLPLPCIPSPAVPPESVTLFFSGKFFRSSGEF
jgi:hypothetical protein